MSKELICPYCGAVQETHEPDQTSVYMRLTECEKCKWFFWYSFDVMKGYDSWVGDEE